MDDATIYKTWAFNHYTATYCDAARQPAQPLWLDEFKEQLATLTPPNSTPFQDIREGLDADIAKAIVSGFPVDKRGYFTNPGSVMLALRQLRPDLAEKKMLGQAIAKLEGANRQAKLTPPAPPPVSAITPQPGGIQRGLPSTDFSFTFAHSSSLKEDVPVPLFASEAAELFVLAQLECDKYTWTPANRVQNQRKVISAVQAKKPHIHPSYIKNAVLRAEEKRRHRTISLASASASAFTQGSSQPTIKSQIAPPNVTEAWVRQQYLLYGYHPHGTFKGYPSLSQHLRSVAPAAHKERAVQILNQLRKSGKLNVDRDAPVSARARKAQREQTTLPAHAPASYPTRASKPHREVHKSSPGRLTYADGFKSGTVYTFTGTPTPVDAAAPTNDLLARKLERLNASEAPTGNNSSVATSACAADDETMALLLEEDSDEDGADINSEADHEFCHAPLIAANMIASASQRVIPQYGLLGSYEKGRIFLNTNIPFSAFVCGVQGSGKSHTTACILENGLIPSPQLGRLQRPLSALVFSYGQFGGDGSGFSISEAAFLAAPHPAFPTHPYVKRINVLVSPSNYVRMNRLYSRIANVTVSPFKLKASSLDIDIMLTLMNVSESDEQPLYMAAVIQILRQMATDGGPFNYFTFRGKLKQCRFNPTQVNMLQMRLGLLESFLDLHNTCPESQFREGEVTIMDMSCPFVDANTACILFRIGLQKYLQSGAAGKMIVLDEAHKYMLPNPGAKSLNETLLTTIRLQRHYGARIIISTQEPTLLTDLIALCSVTIIHRFSSPEWFAAIKRHIPISAEEHHMIIRAIESLKIGSALVYSPGTILGRRDDGTLIKGTGRLLKLNVRKRVTSDGGQSVLAV